MSRLQENKTIYLVALGFFALLLVTYSNHFNNAFHFDDHHAIKSNKNVRDIANIPKIFLEKNTESGQNARTAYRPMVTTLNAIDYWMAGNKYDVFYFHLSQFFWYIVLLVILFFVLRNILDKSYKHPWNPMIALFITAYYGLHTANAETVNYIIARSDSFSTLCMVAALWFYQMPKMRKYHLYLLPMALGLFTKQTGVMFPPLLFCYILLFEEQISWQNFFGRQNQKRLLRTIQKSAPAFAVGIGLYLFNSKVMQEISGYNSSRSKWLYLLTQFDVMTNYMGNFILPTNLAVETDIKMVKSATEPRVLWGFLLILSLIGVGIWGLQRKVTYPVTYGIMWCFLALVPTSSILPRWQIANHHRLFFPFIGLVLVVGWLIGWWLVKNEHKVRQNNILRWGILILCTLILCGYAYGTYERNKAWKSGASLWGDGYVKSPENPRILEQWGNILKIQGEDEEALKVHLAALEYWKKSPGLNLSVINLKQKLDPDVSPNEIEEHFEAGLKRGGRQPKIFYKYAKFLVEQKNETKAQKILKRCVKINTKGKKSREKVKNQCTELLAEIKGELMELKQSKIDTLLASIEREPTEKKYYKLGNLYYGIGNYEEGVKASQEAIKLNSERANNYNLLCICHNQLKQWDKGIVACEKARELNPKHKKAKANLKWARDGKKKAAEAAKNPPVTNDGGEEDYDSRQ